YVARSRIARLRAHRAALPGASVQSLRAPVFAFTLIELLVVVAILALLLAILLPSLSAARESGRSTKCLANLHSIGQGVVMYCDGNDGRFPISSHTAGSLASPGAWLATLER